MANINLVVLSGNLTREPEHSEHGGRNVCKLGLAVNDRKKEGDEWVDVPNYFDVDVWSAEGGPADWCRDQLRKGSPVTVSGKLRWRTWEQDGANRSAISVVAENVVLPPRESSGASEAAPGADLF